MPSPTPPMTVGQLAATAGVSPQTLRHYDAIGLLRPSATSPAGYRLYGDRDRAQLELIRALRAMDFDLPTIGRLIRGVATMRGVGELHLRTLDHQARTIARRRAILRMLLDARHEPTPERLARLQALASFERVAREEWVAEQLRSRLGGAGESPFERMLIAAASVDLPDAATEQQLEAWLELAEMVSDPAFLERHRTAQARRGQSRPGEAQAAWRDRVNSVYQSAVRAAAAGVSPSGRVGRLVVRKWARATFAQAANRPWRAGNASAERRQARELLAMLTSAESEREARFWELVAILKPEVGRSPMGIAWGWLMDGLRAWAESGS